MHKETVWARSQPAHVELWQRGHRDMDTSNIPKKTVFTTYFIIIIIIIRNGWKCMAGRELFTPSQSEDPSPTISTHRMKEEKLKNSRIQKVSEQLGQ